MKWSFRIGRVAGIDLYVHVTFFLLLAWFGIEFYNQRHLVGDVVVGFAFIIALFAIVVLHELGHALTARYFGIRTRDIILLPIGGLARLERMPEDPKQELLVALAGPAVNFALAGLLFGVIHLLGDIPSWKNVTDASLPFLARLLLTNLFMGVFNLLPAFPMDGGRVLRALLAMWMDYVRATRVAAIIGRGMAVVFVVVGFFYSPMLLLIGLFVWMGAGAEANMVQMRSGMSGIPISRAMLTDFQTLSPQQPLGEALQLVLSGFQQDFPVVQGGRVFGLLTREALLRQVQSGNTERRVGDVMARNFVTARPNETLETVATRMQECQCQALPVVQNGKLVGLVTLELLGRFLAALAAVKQGNVP